MTSNMTQPKKKKKGLQSEGGQMSILMDVFACKKKKEKKNMFTY